MADATLKLARKIKNVVDANPEATVREIAAQTQIEVDQVIAILDSHIVGDDGKISHAGEGQGGGWVPLSEDPEPEA